MGISGFMRPGESIHDPFVTGHASNAVSAALGLARAARLQGKSIRTVAVLGDGALTGGLAYSNRFTGNIKQRVDQIARVLVYPGEDEMLALSEGVLRVLEGRERVQKYE